MENAIYIFSNLYRSFIKDLRRQVKTLNKYNRLLKNLFEGKRNFPLTFQTLKEGMVIYFKDSKIKQSSGWGISNKKEFINIGRVLNEDHWVDYNLSPYEFTNNHYFSVSNRFPLYKVIAVKSSGIMIHDMDSKQEIKLLPNRTYKPHILFLKGMTQIFIQRKIISGIKSRDQNEKQYITINTIPNLKKAKLDEFF